MSEKEVENLWEELNRKLCVNLINSFSEKDINAWLGHFVQNKNIDFYLFGEKGAGVNQKKPNSGKPKILRLYNGAFFTALTRFRIPAKIIAWVLFKRLEKQNFSHSTMQIVEIDKSSIYSNKTTVKAKFKRFNKSGEVFEEAFAVYDLLKIENQWFISKLSIFDDDNS